MDGTDPKPEDGKLATAVTALVAQVKALVPVNQSIAGGSGFAGGGPNKGDVLAAAVLGLLTQIRDGIRLLVSQGMTGALAVNPNQGTASNRSVKAKGPAKKAKKGGGGFGWGRALQPITNALKSSRLGQIGGRFLGRAKPAWKAMGGARAAGGLGRMLGGLGGGGGLGGILGGGAGAGGAAGGGAAAGAAGAAAAVGAAAAPVAIVIAAGIAFKEAADEVVKFAYSMEQANRALAQVSPSMAAVFAELDAERVKRDINRGENTADTAAGLADAINRFEEATQPWEEISTNIKNLFSSALLDILNEMLELVEPISEWARERLRLPARDDSGADLSWLQQTYQQEQARAAATARTMDRLRDQHYRR